MNITNFHGSTGFLMAPEGGEGGSGGGLATVTGGEGGGGESTALAITTGDDSAVTTTGEEGTGGESTALTTGSFRAVERGKPTRAATEALQYLETSKPEYKGISNIVQKALIFRDRVLGMFPGKNPFQEMETMQKDLKALGGQKGIAAIKTELADVEENDLLYAAGDAKLIAKMTLTPAAQQAYLKIMPHALARWEALAPNRMSAWFAKAFLGHMKTATMNTETGDTFDIGMAIRRIQSVIPKTDAEATPENLNIMRRIVTEEAGVLQRYMNLLQAYTQLKPEELAPAADDKTVSDRQKFEQEKTDFRNGQWRDARDGEAKRIAKVEWAKQSKGLTISPRQEQNIFAGFNTRLQAARRTLTDYRAAVDSFAEANDKEGFLAYHRDFFETTIPRLLAREIKDELGEVKKAPVTKETAGQPQTARVTPIAGVTSVKAWPNSNGSDLKRGPGGTTPEMIGKREGIASRNNQWKVAEGTKVSWAHLKA